MYLPNHFAEVRQEELVALIESHPLGALVRSGPSGLDANHMPFLIEEEHGVLRLSAHVARANPLWREANDGDAVLVIFGANDAYVSPNWYPSKHEFHRQVPTWNYRVVHVHGRILIRDDERFVRGIVAKLTRTHETRAMEPKPWKMTDSSPEYINQMLANIVGIEVEIVRIVGKSKLSQNREERDRRNAANELERRGQNELSEAMLRTIEPKK